jgi:DNA-binding NtrC family response regulator
MKLHVPSRFSCVFLTTSKKDAGRLNPYLAAAGIRCYHAGGPSEAKMLLAMTRAKVLLIDIDRTSEPWLKALQNVDEACPGVPKVVLTARGESTWSLILARSALDVIPKPAHLGDLLGALEYAHSVAQEIHDPERVQQRKMRVMAAIRSSTRPVGLSAMMNKVTHVCWKFGRARPGFRKPYFSA